jgi:uncharacterized membrane protein
VIPFRVMLVAIALARIAGALGFAPLDGWHAATRAGLAVMFAFTAVAHFDATRADLIRMIPPAFPRPGLWVTLTGIAEFAGAAGLLVPALARWSGWGLALMLVVLFSANLHAARTSHTIGGRPHTPMALRLPLQILWIGLLVWSVS